MDLASRSRQDLKQDVIKCTNLSLTQWAKKDERTNKLSMVCNILKYSRPTVHLFYLHDFKKKKNRVFKKSFFIFPVANQNIKAKNQIILFK